MSIKSELDELEEYDTTSVYVGTSYIGDEEDLPYFKESKKPLLKTKRTKSHDLYRDSEY